MFVVVSFNRGFYFKKNLIPQNENQRNLFPLKKYFLDHIFAPIKITISTSKCGGSNPKTAFLLNFAN